MMDTTTETYAPECDGERRCAERVAADLPARWEGVLVRLGGSVVDISSTGCFILTADKVTTGELIRIEIESPYGRWVRLWGEVVYQFPEMGFALRFTGSDEEDQTALEDLLLDLRAKQVLECV